MDDDISQSASAIPAVPQTHEEALRYLCRPISKAAYPPDPTPLRSLLASLGHPERQFRSVIVTGSVGKGTVAHLLAAALREAGIRTGLFTGPHLHYFRERMAIDGDPIDVPALVEQAGRVALHAGENIGRLSTFELTTALAFDWFASQGVEVAVLEVGIGGRFDAVNFAPAESAVIMPIELEHTTLLGDSLAAIAYHKAGVIHENGFAVVAPQSREVFEVIVTTCQERGATLVEMARVGRWNSPAHGAYHVSYGDVSLRGQTPLLGRHNMLNIAIALAWVMQANARGYAVAPAHVAQAARHLRMPGRVEMVGRDGVSFLIDGAHTPTAAMALSDTLESLSPPGPLTYLIGMSRDKNAPGFLRALHVAERADVVLTTFSGHRAMSLADLSRLAAEVGLKAQAIPSLSEAIGQVTARHQGKGLVVATGSLHMAAQTREQLGLLSDELLAETMLNRSIFSGPEYLALVDSDPTPDKVSRLPSR
jgi:dihydrofolate synthase/folylpolyglutamate synthase